MQHIYMNKIRDRSLLFSINVVHHYLVKGINIREVVVRMSIEDSVNTWSVSSMSLGCHYCGVSLVITSRILKRCEK